MRAVLEQLWFQLLLFIPHFVTMTSAAGGVAYSQETRSTAQHNVARLQYLRLHLLRRQIKSNSSSSSQIRRHHLGSSQKFYIFAIR